MLVQVKFFALGRELVGRSELTVELPAGATVQQAVEEIKNRHERFARLNSFVVAVNMEYADRETVLADGDVLAIIPPVSGG